MKNIQKNPASTKEIIFILLNIVVLWAGFISFGQFFSGHGYYSVSWKWQLVSALIAATLFLVSLLFLFALLVPRSKVGALSISLKENLEQKPLLLLVIPFLVVVLLIAIYLYPLIRGLFGINVFSFMLLWLFALPIILFLLYNFKKQDSASEIKTISKPKKETKLSLQPGGILNSLGKWNALWMGVLFTLYLVSFFTPWSLYSFPSWAAFLLFLLLSFTFGWGMKGIFPEKNRGYCFVASFLMVAAGASLASFFTRVNNDPFSLGWSEGTWIFNGSLIFSKLIYGTHLNPPILYANRAILQSLPFLVFPAAPLWVHRLWQAVLWSVLPLAFGVLFSKKLGLSGLSRFVFIAWTFLFLQQGPVYYFLFIAPILILLAGKVPRFWLATLLVVAASIWIGIDRVNWFPLPGCLMTMMYLFETRYNRKFWAYWWKPLVWILGGTLVAFAARFGLWLVSGYPGSYFLTSITSNLLTYRLLPNSTNPLGILPLIALTILPITAVLLASISLIRVNLHWSRLWILLGILLVFFLGDMLVSLKIGGGNNLHNYDGFLLLLVISFSMFFFGKVNQDDTAGTEPLRAPAWLLGLVALIPVVVSYMPISLPSYSNTDAQTAVKEINQQIAALPPDAKPVLFINQTQLLATGQVKDVLPVPAYEMDLMMEMAMANNFDYLNKLYSDLSNQRYSLIVAPELNIFQKGPEWSFGEENDAWNNVISVPILMHYHVIYIEKDFNIEILIPNEPIGK